MKALIDGDILRYEVGYAAETGWRNITEREEVPPFDYVEDLLLYRISIILSQTHADDYCLYLTEGRTFRYDLAKKRPYKGNRVDKKPWHFYNLTAYMKNGLPCEIVTGIEADDAMAIDGCSDLNTIICSRDKDLKQIPCWGYSWELGKSPGFGPQLIDPIGDITLSENHKTVKGTGFKFFCAQMLMGDKVDNIPGIVGLGPVAVMDRLESKGNTGLLIETVITEYQKCYGEEWEEEMIEQGNLLWIVRELNRDGSPKIWENVYREIYEKP
jgi:5'-3' exonuclease